MREQEGWDEHAAFMEALQAEGFVALGGMLGDEERVLLVIRAAEKQEIERRLADDPWSDHVLRIASIEPWTVLLGSL
jgi:uncharacterized protein YciI